MLRSKLIGPVCSRRRFVGGVVAALGVAACDTGDDGSEGGDSTDERMHVGTLAGTNVAIAAIVDGASLTIYVCGNEATLTTHTRWFRAVSITDGAFTGSDDAGWSVEGTVDEGIVRGTVTSADGTASTFEAAGVRKGSVSGLYTAVQDGCETGVIVQSNDDAMDDEPDYDVQGAWCNAMAEFDQVIILQPVTLTANGGIDAMVLRPEGELRFEVLPF